MNRTPWVIAAMILLSGFSIWLWQQPGDGDPWPPGKPHPRASGMGSIGGTGVLFPPLAEAPRQATASSALAAALSSVTLDQVIERLGQPDERIGGSTAKPAHVCWWSLARYDGDTGDTGWHNPVVHLWLELTDGVATQVHWIGGEGRELGTAVAPPPPPAIPAGMGPPHG